MGDPGVTRSPAGRIRLALPIDVLVEPVAYITDEDGADRYVSTPMSRLEARESAVFLTEDRRLKIAADARNDYDAEWGE